MRYWLLTGILVAGFVLQSVVATYLAIGGVAPDLVLVLVIIYGLLFGWEAGLGAGLLGGLLIDLNAGQIIGLYVLSFGTVGLLAGVVEEKVFKENLLLAPVGGLLGTIVGHCIIMICLLVLGRSIDLYESFRRTVLPAALYNMVLAALVYGRIYRYYLYLRPDPRGTIIVRRN